MKGQKPGEKLEGYVERLIREAQEDGAFDGLRGRGRPLPYLGPRDEAWWIKEKLRREKLNALPESLAIRYEAESVLEQIDGLDDERVVRARLEELNARIRKVNRTTAAGPPTTVAPVDVEAVLGRWRARRSAPAGRP